MPQLEPTAWSTRAQVVYRRSYSRPLDAAGTEFETWEQTIDRVIRHQRWLWERAKGKDLNGVEREELDELKALMLDRKGYLAGRTLWLGGTELSRTRESCSFNCAGLRIKTVFDVVDALWLLLQGVGVGFTPVMGVLNGFTRQIPEIEVIRSERKYKGGAERNTETWLSDSKTWILQIGDSAKAWSKAVGKLIAGKYPAKKLVIDLSQIRPAGDRLRGYGWISSGDEQLSKAIVGICAVLNHAAGRLLTVIDILDVMNWLGSILSSRRSAELALLPSNHPSWREFALAKKNHFEYNPQRAQSNNCFSGDTRFITKSGCFSLEEMVNQPVTILNKNGEWESGFVESYGFDELFEITFTNGDVVYATENHRWWQKDGSRVTTNELEVVPLVAHAKFPEIDPEGIRHGIIFGGGCLKPTGRYSFIVFCTPEKETLSQFFEDEEVEIFVNNNSPRHYKTIRRVKAGLSVHFQPPHFKELPITYSPEYARGFIAGLIATDGSCKTSSVTISCCKGKEIAERIREIAVVGGCVVSSLKMVGAPNNSWHPGLETWTLSIKPFSAPLIREDQKKDMERPNGHYKRKLELDVFEIKPTGRFEEVFCCTVPKSESFTLANGVVTSNSLVFYEKPSKSQLFEIFDLMLEGGGSEPGIMNGEEALRRAPYFSAFNPSLRGNTRLVTSLGIVPIADLEGQSFEVKNLYGEWKPATCWLSGHDKTLWKIKLRGGHEIYATKEHKWPVMIDNQVIKVATCDLQKGHRLPNLESDILFEGHEGCYDEGFFCGWVFGDGWITERKDTGTFQLGMTVSEVDADVMPILQRFLKQLGSEVVFKKNKSCAAYELCTTHRGLIQVLQRCGMLEHRKNGLPKMLFTTASEDFRRGFIDGLVSADGGIGKTEVGKKERGGLGFTTCHQQVAQDFSDLLGFYGIQTKVSGGKLKHIPTFPNGKVYDRSYESYLVKVRIHSSLVRFQEVFKLSASRKQRLLELAVTLQTGPRDPANYRHPNTFVDVMSVEKTDIKEDVWDIRVEDDTHCFQLAHCITGNCAEILLGDKGFCNLCELVLPKFNGDFDGACRAITLLARANYRQTCVNLDDGVLQRTWHELNEYLHLCGVGLTGIVEWDRQMDKTAYQALRAKARAGADSMALELDLPYAELVTTTKPSGTLSKMSDCTEGVHKPLGRFIFNNINFSKHDPLIPILQAANYNVFENPYDSTGVLVTFPVEYSDVKFTQVDGKWVNLESAVTQLERYRLLMENYVDHNVSCTISYSPGEVGQIVDWLHAHWDSYVATAFMFRNDPTKTAEDMGYPYLPQEVVEEEKYRAYVAKLLPIDLIDAIGHFEIDSQECRSGMCPIK